MGERGGTSLIQIDLIIIINYNIQKTTPCTRNSESETNTSNRIATYELLV